MSCIAQSFNIPPLVFRYSKEGADLSLLVIITFSILPNFFNLHLLTRDEIEGSYLLLNPI